MDIFDEAREVTYSDIIADILKLETEASNLDDDSLLDEVDHIQHIIVGKESTRIQSIVMQSKDGSNLRKDDRKFLREIYVAFYSKFIIPVDYDEEDEEDDI